MAEERAGGEILPVEIYQHIVFWAHIHSLWTLQQTCKRFYQLVRARLLREYIDRAMANIRRWKESIPCWDRTEYFKVVRATLLLKAILATGIAVFVDAEDALFAEIDKRRRANALFPHEIVSNPYIDPGIVDEFWELRTSERPCRPPRVLHSSTLYAVVPVLSPATYTISLSMYEFVLAWLKRQFPHSRICHAFVSVSGTWEAISKSMCPEVGEMALRTHANGWPPAIVRHITESDNPVQLTTEWSPPSNEHTNENFLKDAVRFHNTSLVSYLLKTYSELVTPDNVHCYITGAMHDQGLFTDRMNRNALVNNVKATLLLLFDYADSLGVRVQFETVSRMPTFCTYDDVEVFDILCDRCDVVMENSVIRRMQSYGPCAIMLRVANNSNCDIRWDKLLNLIYANLDLRLSKHWYRIDVLLKILARVGDESVRVRNECYCTAMAIIFSVTSRQTDMDMAFAQWRRRWPFEPYPIGSIDPADFTKSLLHCLRTNDLPDFVRAWSKENLFL